MVLIQPVGQVQVVFALHGADAFQQLVLDQAEGVILIAGIVQWIVYGDLRREKHAQLFHLQRRKHGPLLAQIAVVGYAVAVMLSAERAHNALHRVGLVLLD